MCWRCRSSWCRSRSSAAASTPGGGGARPCSGWFRRSPSCSCWRGLVGYIYYLDHPGARTAGGRARRRRSPRSKADAIEEVRITAADETTRLTKIGQHLDDRRAGAGRRRRRRAVEHHRQPLVARDEPGRGREAGGPRSRSASSRPASTCAFKVKGQAAEQRILLGEKTPIGENLYAKLPDSPRVFLVPSYLEAAFNKTTFALRDKAVLKVDRQKADGLELKAGTDGDRARQVGRELVAREADRRPRRLRGGRRRDRAPVVGADAGARPRIRTRRPSVRLRRADRDDDDQDRQLERHADARQDRERRGVRQGLVAPARSSRWRRRCASTS